MSSQLLIDQNIEVTHTEVRIKKRVAELADKIVLDYYKDVHNKNDEPPVFIVIMHGAMLFASDLIRAIGSRMHLVLDSLTVKSYDGQETSGNVKILFDIRTDIKDRNVFIVEDIVDTGYTIQAIINLLALRNPHSINICSMFDKPSRRIVKGLTLHYVGFSIPNYFIVGYGMDEDEKYRHLPFAGRLKK